MRRITSYDRTERVEILSQCKKCPPTTLLHRYLSATKMHVLFFYPLFIHQHRIDQTLPDHILILVMSSTSRQHPKATGKNTNMNVTHTARVVAASSSSSSNSTKSTYKTCLWLLTSPDGCRRGDTCKLSHNHAEIVKEYSLVCCANTDDCVAVTAFNLHAPLLTNPRFGATCMACRDAEERRVRQSQTPCRWYGRSTTGCRKGDSCEFLHDRELVMEFYELHECPSSETKWGCVNKINPNLCAGRMCPECHHAMLERRERANQKRDAREAKAAAVWEKRKEAQQDGDYEDEREWLPCKARKNCPNQTQGSACEECVQLDHDHRATIPEWARKQRLGRFR